MGWKAFNIFASSRVDGYLASFPAPIPQKAREFLLKLGQPYRGLGEASLDTALYPGSDTELYIGAYDHALVLGSSSIAQRVFMGEVPDAVQIACDQFPNTLLLVAMLHSVTNLFGYAF